ncbi:hypothetical protein [Mucilaginibacter arboris]|uniref:RNA polymerase sigma-70 region 2 domain-containing protein n=1 Tax=Mucilaginibacter arboris TaxID=2682090 RepID=A0A7K1T0E9_9SPHI|nr:hypothetical protein [Mucilaginibacter arboris]MVN22997.1 hypothetical protein [Mucilaginibacter arboris]
MIAYLSVPLVRTETISLSDTEIISLLEADSIAGTMALYDRYVAPLILAIFRIVREKERADEILVKTLVIVSKTYSTNLKQKENLLPWVMAIAREQANLFRLEKTAAIIDAAGVAS